MKKGISHPTPFPITFPLFSKIQNSTSDFLQSPSGAFSQFFPTFFGSGFWGDCLG